MKFDNRMNVNVFEYREKVPAYFHFHSNFISVLNMQIAFPSHRKLIWPSENEKLVKRVGQLETDINIIAVLEE